MYANSSILSRPSLAKAKGAQPPKLATKATLIRAFDAGDFSTFSRHWSSIIENYRNDISVIHLDFYIRIYFVTYGLRNAPVKAKIYSVNRSMENFKAYLESSVGIELRKRAEFAPYFALPYVKNIETHPIFKELKKKKWALSIRERLVDFLDTKLVLKRDENQSDLTGTNVEKQPEVNDRLDIAERRITFYKNRYANLQANYHRLILVAAELVDALEQAIRGIQITPEQVEDLRNRLFDTRFNSISSSGRNQSIEDEDKLDDLDGSSSMDRNKEFSGAKSTVGETCEPSTSSARNSSVFDPESVDWQKIKQQLQLSSGKETALLLQALRWTLTKCDNPVNRHEIISFITEHDLLGSRDNERHILTDLMDTANFEIQDQLMRFIGALTSLKPGRHYLLKDRRFLPWLVQNVCNYEAISKVTSIQEYGIGILQRCSLRRNVQLRLIRLNLLEWLIGFLQMNNKTLPNYAFEYGMALLMDLCLTTSGRKAAAEDPEKILHLLNDIMNHENATLVAPYVNGALFSVLGLAHVRHKAKKLGLYSILDKALQRSKSPDDIIQIPYIIKRLNGELIEKQPPSSDEEMHSDDETEIGNSSEDEAITVDSQSNRMSEFLEPELDENDQLMPDSTCELAGFELLKSRYYKYGINQSVLPFDSEKPLHSENSLGRDPTTVTVTDLESRDTPTRRRRSTITTSGDSTNERELTMVEQIRRRRSMTSMEEAHSGVKGQRLCDERNAISPTTYVRKHVDRVHLRASYAKPNVRQRFTVLAPSNKGRTRSNGDTEDQAEVAMAENGNDVCFLSRRKLNGNDQLNDSAAEAKESSTMSVHDLSLDLRKSIAKDSTFPRSQFMKNRISQAGSKRSSVIDKMNIVKV